MVLRVFLDPLTTGTYAVNPILVNNQNQPIEDGDAFADLVLESTSSGGLKHYSTNAGNGGSLIISSVESNEIKGSFNIALLELLTGMNPPEINIQGEFTATK